jgi:hypothetical protein
MSDWIPKALMRLLELSRLEENWNSYGGVPPHPEALGYAVQLLGIFADAHWNVPEPAALVSNCDGGIGFDWRPSQGPWLELELEENVIAAGIFVPKDSKDLDGYVTFTDSTLADLCKRLAEIDGWLTA